LNGKTGRKRLLVGHGYHRAPSRKEGCIKGFFFEGGTVGGSTTYKNLLGRGVKKNHPDGKKPVKVGGTFGRGQKASHEKLTGNGSKMNGVKSEGQNSNTIWERGKFWGKEKGEPETIISDGKIPAPSVSQGGPTRG